jgi:5-methylcytosine-specific restriction endonuclease McrA
MSHLDESVLVLNKDFFAIEVTDARDAICSLVMNRAKVVDHEYRTFGLKEWGRITKELVDDKEMKERYPYIVRSPSLELFVPHVIILEYTDYLPAYNRTVRFSRKSVYQRDEYTCQYCGKKPGRDDINLDHIIPKSRGGTNSWKNVVTSCIYCNARKGNKLLSELGWKLIQEPKEPKWKSHIGSPFSKIKAKAWNMFLR